METLQRTANRGSLSTGYDIDNSLKLEADNSENLYRDLNASTSTTKFTHSMWVKRTELTNAQLLYMRGVAGNEAVLLRFSNESGYEHGLQVDIGASGTNARSVTTRKFRDTSAWYHIVLAVDTTQSTAANRRRLYVNGVEETVFGMNNLPSQNFAMEVSSAKHRYGAYNDTDNFAPFSGYIAECHYIDGSQLDASSFGETDNDSGIWKPKQYTGSYGTGGYYLDFSDSSALGNNSAGDSTDFTLRNISAADQATDTPTNNFCTLNILDQEFDGTNIVTDGATNVRIAGSGSGCIRGTQAVSSGKWYWEFKLTPINTSTFYGVWGIYTADLSPPAGYPGQQAGSWGVYGGNGEAAGGSGFNTFYTDGFSSGDIIGLAYDVDGGTLIMYKNGSVVGANSGDIIATSGVSHPAGFTSFLPAFADGTNSPAPSGLLSRFEVNFGGFTNFSISSGNSDANGYGNFEYAPPSGYYAICSKNLAEYG